MTILEDLKSGRLVVVPREADLADYDAGLLNDRGGGNVNWWQDYLRAEIGRANDFWRSQIASPDHTAGLIALVEGMERERDEARALLERCRTVLGNMARENEGAIFNRWPINHEPLRADARNLLPLIEKEIGCES